MHVGLAGVCTRGPKDVSRGEQLCPYTAKSVADRGLKRSGFAWQTQGGMTET